MSNKLQDHLRTPFQTGLDGDFRGRLIEANIQRKGAADMIDSLITERMWYGLVAIVGWSAATTLFFMFV